MMKEFEVHKLAEALETRNKLKSLTRFVKIPSAVTITMHSGVQTRSVTLKGSHAHAVTRFVEDCINEIEDAAVDFGVVFDEN